jgi:hypothetical protein
MRGTNEPPRREHKAPEGGRGGQEGVYQPDEVEYAIKKIEEIITRLEKETRKER